MYPANLHLIDFSLFSSGFQDSMYSAKFTKKLATVSHFQNVQSVKATAQNVCYDESLWKICYGVGIHSENNEYINRKGGEWKKVVGEMGKKWRGKKMNFKCNSLASEETTGILYAIASQFYMNFSLATAC